MNLSKAKNEAFILFYFKFGILLFWGLWFSLAFSSNLTDFLINTHLISPILFRSGNYAALKAVLNIYHTPVYFLNGLFILDILMQGLCAVLFFIAAGCFYQNKSNLITINFAFAVSIFLWAAFLIMEEIFIAYSYESVHIKLLIFAMLSLLTLHLLPAKNNLQSS